jgi:hypothetical protein
MKKEPPLRLNPGNKVDEAELAWALAQATHPHLDTVERHDIYIAIGVGETFSAIASLIATVVGRQLSLPAQLVNRLVSWLDAYAGNDVEPQLRRLIAQVTPQPLHQPSSGPDSETN